MYKTYILDFSYFEN